MTRRLLLFILFIIFLIFLIPSIKANTYLFENSTWQGGLTSSYFTSIATGDINNDGLWDLAQIGCVGSSGGECNNYIAKIYINNGTGLYNNSTWGGSLTAVHYGSIAFGDIDNDDDLDLILNGCNNGGASVSACNDGGQSFVYLNNGTGLSENSTWKGNIINVAKASIALGDIDNDGKLDLVLAGQSSIGNVAKIYINNGSSFIENSTWQNDLTAVFAGSTTLVDIDNDNDLDLGLIGDSLGAEGYISKIYINNGTTFIENSTWQQNLVGVETASSAWGDYDNDGDMDLTIMGHTSSDEHEIYNNTGTTLTRIQNEDEGLTPSFEGTQVFGDYDNDGDLDLLISGEEKYTTLHLYDSNTGLFTLFNDDPESGIFNTAYGPSAVWNDVDNDTDLDLILIGYDYFGEVSKAKIYINNISTPNTKPNAPNSSFNATFDDGKLILTWGNGSDAETSVKGLYYNLRVGTTSGGNDVISGVYGGGYDNGYFGNMMQRKSISIKGLSASTTYYYSVQTIDTGLAKSSWSAEQTYSTAADIINPTIELIFPANNYNTSNNYVHFGANVTDETDLTNVSLYGDWTGSFIRNQTNSTGNNGNHTFNVSLTVSGTYQFYIQACDNTGNCAETTARTFYIDRTPPAVILSSPADTTITKDNNVTFNYQTSDNFHNAVNCSLYINGTLNITNSSVPVSSSLSTHAFHANNLGDGNYRWNVKCQDFLGNVNFTSTNYTLTVDTIAPTAAAAITASNVADSDNDGNIEVTWIDSNQEDNERYLLYRHSSNITSSNINSAILIANVSEGTQSYEDISTTHNNEYWYALVTADSAGNYNISNPTASWNATARDTIIPKPTNYFNVTSSGAVATLHWNNVSQDVNENNDLHGMMYRVYVSATSVNLSNGNITTNTAFSLYAAVSTNTTTYSSTTSGTNVFHFVVTSYDDANNENENIAAANYANISLTYTAPSTPSSGSGGGGGGGGGGGAVSTTNYAKIWNTMPIGENVMPINKEKISINEIKINVKNTLKQAEVKVASLGNKKPAIIEKDVKGVSYQFLEITKKNIEDKDIENVVIKFKVERKWINENNIDEKTVALNRYATGWNKLETKLINAIGDYTTYESVTSGFSYFAITGENKTIGKVKEEKDEAELIEEEIPIEEKEEFPEGVKGEKKINVLILIVIIFSVLLVWYYYVCKLKRKDKNVFRKKN